MLEFPCSRTRLGEDRRAISVPVLVNNLDTFVKRVRLDDNEDGSKYLLIIALHRSVRLDNCWSNEIATFVTRNLNMASVKVYLATLLLSGSDQSKNSVFGSW